MSANFAIRAEAAKPISGRTLHRPTENVRLVDYMSGGRILAMSDLAQ